MIQTLLGTVYNQEPIDQMLIIRRHIFQLILIHIILLIILNALKLYLHKLRTGRPTLRCKVSNHLPLIDLSDAFDGERPEYFLADHDKYLALVHAAGVGYEREGDLEDAEGLDLEF